MLSPNKLAHSTSKSRIKQIKLLLSENSIRDPLQFCKNSVDRSLIYRWCTHYFVQNNERSSMTYTALPFNISHHRKWHHHQQVTWTVYKMLWRFLCRITMVITGLTRTQGRTQNIYLYYWNVIKHIKYLWKCSKNLTQLFNVN